MGGVRGPYNTFPVRQPGNEPERQGRYHGVAVPRGQLDRPGGLPLGGLAVIAVVLHRRALWD